MIKAFDGYVPEIGSGVFLADGVIVVGHVELGEGANVWYGSVLRGDAGPIRIGSNTSVQSLCGLHMKSGGQELDIGSDVSVGQGVMIRGAKIGDGTFIGDGAIIMDGVEIGEQSIVIAGAFLPRGMKVPARKLVKGRPAKVVRDLEEKEYGSGKRAAAFQRSLANKAE
jgi:carbonic anhydrase/acetyltransferase-like protein (isoleucine patch superfamily)